MGLIKRIKSKVRSIKSKVKSKLSSSKTRIKSKISKSRIFNKIKKTKTKIRSRISRKTTSRKITKTKQKLISRRLPSSIRKKFTKKNLKRAVSLGVAVAPISKPFQAIKAVRGVKKMGLIGKIVKSGAGLYAAEQIAERLGVRGGAGFIGKRKSSGTKKRRVIDVTSLSNAMRRLKKFDNIQKKVEKNLKKIAPKQKARTKTPGIITESEAYRALRN